MPLDDSDVCAHCGQPLPGRKVVSYGERGPSRTGVIVTVALHLLLVAVWLFHPKVERHAPPKSGEAIVWLPPLKPNKPAPAQQPARQPAKPAPAKPSKPHVAKVQRLPNTITLPHEKPVEESKPQPKEETRPQPDETDMAAYIEKRRKARGAPSQSEQPAEESEAARGTRNALANIAAINGRGGQDTEESLFSVTHKTFNSADLKFRGWNSNFKRRWLTSVTVERGNERDIETATVKKMIEMIRTQVTGDFEFRLRSGKEVTLSARPQDTQELMNFLYKEVFPEYRPPRG
jgi:type IV secretory pathway VirB10-like protein